MSETWVIIEHEDGRRYSVRDTDPRANGEAGWRVEGAEAPDAFVVKGVTKPRAPRKRPTAKNAALIAPAPVPAPDGEAES
jgi:hypothetical protein